MDRSYPSALRIKQRLRFRQRVVAAVSAGIAAAAMTFALVSEGAPAATPEREAPAALQAGLAPAAAGATPSARRVYRYSVAPGGAASQAELARIVRHDRVVAAHYAGFDVDKARPVTVAAPRAVHVSYRRGGKVYWTAKKVMLQAGETLLTDGRNEMRTRCANRISDVPRFPVERHAPPPADLDTPEDERTEGELVNVEAPELVEPDELPRFSYQPVWPAPANPQPADAPPRARTPFAGPPASGLPWPQMAWLGAPGLPPQSGTLPAEPGLPNVAPPPMSRAVEVPAAPLPPAPPLVRDLTPLIPLPDPALPAVPQPPALDLPPPADVPEPASSWLVGAALVAMLRLRKKR
jgi:hypothetical protein